jgi:type IV secretory pathway VirB6-like protein
MYSNSNRVYVPNAIKIGGKYFMHLCSLFQEKFPFYSKVCDAHTSFAKQDIYKFSTCDTIDAWTHNDNANISCMSEVFSSVSTIIFYAGPLGCQIFQVPIH